MPSSSAEAKWLNASTLWLGVPHRTQFDGTFYAETNCGPASLGMVLEAYGLKGYPTDALRGEVNRFQGNSSHDQGTSLPAIAAVAQRAGLFPIGLYSRPGAYKRWTLGDLREHLTEGRPIITLVRYADLPGAGTFDLGTNHYIVLSGLLGDQFIYNDSAHPQGRGGGLLISPETLQRAWAGSVIPGHAVALALDVEGAGLLSRTAADEPEEVGTLDEGPMAEDADLAPLPDAASADPEERDDATVSSSPRGETAVQSVSLESPQPANVPPGAASTVILVIACAFGAAAIGRLRSNPRR